ncbi:hypothetical protein [Microbacterium sp. LWH10-1.2]|uniref:hypothetical protein n=1 Tax=Microbacterium sp. LWH10-1.2 TaxID=3135255 RepID=UPI0031391901
MSTPGEPQKPSKLSRFAERGLRSKGVPEEAWHDPVKYREWQRAQRPRVIRGAVLGLVAGLTNGAVILLTFRFRVIPEQAGLAVMFTLMVLTIAAVLLLRRRDLREDRDGS